MKRIEESELKEINGGISGWGFVGICAIGTLVIGILNGIVHPAKCS